MNDNFYHDDDYHDEDFAHAATQQFPPVNEYMDGYDTAYYAAPQYAQQRPQWNENTVHNLYPERPVSGRPMNDTIGYPSNTVMNHDDAMQQAYLEGFQAGHDEAHPGFMQRTLSTFMEIGVGVMFLVGIVIFMAMIVMIL